MNTGQITRIRLTEYIFEHLFHFPHLNDIDIECVFYSLEVPFGNKYRLESQLLSLGNPLLYTSDCADFSGQPHFSGKCPLPFNGDVEILYIV